ncbi:hypothetical protein L1987_56807 [Smallanthus sonchifolius]|uniref:Uncharacterized protein n=1 Tax=Smallanthus sonchifolius TaxID=185202 RepID=A0ACB9DBS0_9ASTR|nr:hypothetical protein L1987_56807 [Smallanthus sonchifolius]
MDGVKVLHDGVKLGHFSTQNQLVPTVVESLASEKVVYIACGGSSSAAVTDEGKLYMWGNAKDGQLGVPGLPEIQPFPIEVKFLKDDDGLRSHNVVSVAIGASHALCLVSRSNNTSSLFCFVLLTLYIYIKALNSFRLMSWTNGVDLEFLSEDFSLSQSRKSDNRNKPTMEKSEFGCTKGAEAVLNVPPNSSIPISYHPFFGPHDDLLLLELDEKLLPDVINQRVSLRGESNEDAVLCTKSKTYAVKFVGTSNSVFLVPPSDQFAVDGNPPVASVIKVAPGTMELVEVAPKIDKLKTLILENPYRYDEDDQMHDSGAVEINGYWRIVDDKYMDQVLKMLINNSILNDWSLSSLDENKVVESLVNEGYSQVIAHHCLEVYGSKTNGNVWELDKKRVCVHFARGILLDNRKMKMESFMEEWISKVPGGMVASFDMLEGEILVEKLGIQSLVYAFSVSSLPSDPANRFSRLFQERAKWEWKDLHSYIRDLSVPGLTSDGLLLKYTRRSQPTADAEPVFTAR